MLRLLGVLYMHGVNNCVARSLSWLIYISLSCETDGCKEIDVGIYISCETYGCKEWKRLMWACMRQIYNRSGFELIVSAF